MTTCLIGLDKFRFSSAGEQQPVSLDRRAYGYGLDYVCFDGNDVEAVADGMASVIESTRRGSGAVLVEALTLRGRGHYEGDPQVYRDAQDTVLLTEGDPLRRAAAALVDRGISAAQLAQVEAKVRDEVERAERKASESPEPDSATLSAFVYASPIAGSTGQERRPDDSVVGDDKLSGSKILRRALDDSLAADERVFLAGIDVGHGNVFGITRGLAERYPGRVLDTPISETAIMGLGVGSAMAGLRPVVELMYLDFLGVCFDQLLNQAAKLRLMTGGAASVPLVVRTQFGAGRSSGSQHSQSLEAILAHVPGLKVVMPSSGADIYGMLRSAIEDDDPVVFIENRLLYERRSTLPPREYRVPLGSANVVRSGRDLTLVTWSRMVFGALDAASQLAEEGIEVEVVDLRTIVPLDRQTVLESVQRTGRLLIVHEAVTDFGVGAELAATVASEGFWTLDAPVHRLGGPFSPVPYAPSLERAWLPNVERIITFCRRVVGC